MKKIIGVLLVVWVVEAAVAEMVTFELLGDETLYSLLDNKPFGSITNGGVVATLTASDGILNRTGSGFGINGIGSDDTDALNSNQWIDIVFDQAVVFSNLNISSWNSGADVGEVQLGTSYLSQGGILGTGDTTYDFSVASGEVVRVIALDTEVSNGFSIDSFTVAIPEPAAIIFMTAFGLGLWGVRRFLSL
jgi:hypothetical protein